MKKLSQIEAKNTPNNNEARVSNEKLAKMLPLHIKSKLRKLGIKPERFVYDLRSQIDSLRSLKSAKMSKPSFNKEVEDFFDHLQNTGSGDNNLFIMVKNLAKEDSKLHMLIRMFNVYQGNLEL